MVLCSDCKKRPAFIFLTETHGTKRLNVGLCLLCARKREVPQVTEYMRKMGTTDEDIQKMSEQTVVNQSASETPLPKFISRMMTSTEEQPKNLEEMEKLRLEQEIQIREQNEKRKQEKAEREKAILKRSGKLCSFCQNRAAVVFSKERGYGLCRECAWLFYPQINIHEAETYNIAIEDAVQRGTPPDNCDVCKIRKAQVRSSDGKYCIVCAAIQEMPEANTFAQRMGITSEDLEAFVEKVRLTEQKHDAKNHDKPDDKTAAAVQENAGQTRFRLLCSEDLSGLKIHIVLDTNTGVQYLTNNKFSSFTPLLGKDGNVLLYHEQS